MKIISWNVNWIRAVNKKWFKEFVTKQSPDLLCIQETKAFEEQFLKEVWELEWYQYVWHTWTRAWYAWTAIFYKNNIDIVDTKNHFEELEHFHTDWRVTEIEFKKDWKHIVLFNWYFPNGWTRADGTEMVWYKLDFYNHLIHYTGELKKKWKNIILTWDFNICHTEIDIARPKQNQNSIWFLPVERKKIWELINDWNLDVWRHLNPKKLNIYSWWSYRANSRANNVWWRLDYFVINKEFIENVENMEYMTDILWSDHCPILLKLK